GLRWATGPGASGSVGTWWVRCGDSARQQSRRSRMIGRETRHEEGQVVTGTEVQDRRTALERRVRLLEDQLAIHRLINTWGPAVDGDNPAAAASIWTEDGVLSSDMKETRLDGPAAVARMVRDVGHQELVRAGSAHIQSFPLVAVDGDAAKAIGYSRVYLHGDAG